MKEAYLTPAQERNLIDYVVGHSEAYQHFVDWADREEIPPARRYTARSWVVWLQRHRAKIKQARADHRQATWSGSTFDRKVRLRELEESYAVLRGLASDDPKVVLAIEAAKRNTLELIAKERGETNQKPLTQEDDEQSQVNAQLAKVFGGKT